MDIFGFAFLSAIGLPASSLDVSSDRLGPFVLQSPVSTMVRIAGGTLAMGSDEADVLAALADCVREPYGHRCTPTQFGDELPRHSVNLETFWIDRFEVDIAQYDRCVAAGACAERPTAPALQQSERPDWPATRVSFEEAVAFCAFRGARLPTEAEFERAARGLRGRRYPWGNLFNAHACNHGRFGWDATEAVDGFSDLAPVGSFPAGVSAEGVHDLAGNAAEWVADRYRPSYDPDSVRDPRQVSSGMSSLRVIRGGSYAQAPFALRGAARAFAAADERKDGLGFRCALSEPARRRAEE